MSSTKETISRVAAHLLSAIIVGVVTYLWSGHRAEANAQQQCQTARDAEAAILVSHLDRMLQDASTARSTDDLLVKVRALLAVRNDLRHELAEMSAAANGEFDRVETEANDFAARRARGEATKDGFLRGSLDVLVQKWPAKRAQLEAASRKLQRREEGSGNKAK